MKLKRYLKEVALAVLSAGTTLIIAACYGVYYGEGLQGLANGQVKDGDGYGVRELEVCAEFPAYDTCTNTDAQGVYYLAVDDYAYEEAHRSGFVLNVRDVDGEANGRFSDASVAITAEEVEQAQGILQYDVILESADQDTE